MAQDIKQRKTEKELSAQEKTKRGWWFSVFFMLLVVGLILFLTYVEIVEKNRDVLVGILGMITGSISSMMAIASGRDPSEVEDLKDKLASANADREALIGRLRDAQIQMQLSREQISELQTAVIEKLSIFSGERPIKTKDPDKVILPPTVEEWLPEIDSVDRGD
tara:strand:+ start:1605 stop:2096 length:492 start_codon:yes stop_codon:yes gene_type:complete